MSGISPTTAARTSSTSTSGTCGTKSTGPSARMRLPIRLRLTIVFTLSMAVLLTVTGGFVYFRLGAELLRTVDAALLAEADAVAAGIGQQGAAFSAPRAGSARGLGSFVQVLGPGGKVLETSPLVAGAAVVSAATLHSTRGL